MKGVIFNIVEDVVTEHLGDTVWDQLLDDAGIDHGHTALGTYSDEEMDRLVAAAADALGHSPRQVAVWVGERAVPYFYARYPQYFDSYRSARAFLPNLDQVIHPEVRKLDRTARPPGFCCTHHGLSFLEVNETAQTHYGFDRAEFLRMTLRDIEPVSTLERADQRRSALDPACTQTGLWRHVTRAGRILDVELSMYTVQWAGQLAWLIVAHDVTAQRQAQQTLELRNQAMEASHNGMFICSAGKAEGD